MTLRALKRFLENVFVRRALHAGNYHRMMYENYCHYIVLGMKNNISDSFLDSLRHCMLIHRKAALKCAKLAGLI